MGTNYPIAPLLLALKMCPAIFWIPLLRSTSSSFDRVEAVLTTAWTCIPNNEHFYTCETIDSDKQNFGKTMLTMNAYSQLRTRPRSFFKPKKMFTVWTDGIRFEQNLSLNRVWNCAENDYVQSISIIFSAPLRSIFRSLVSAKAELRRFIRCR